MDPAAYEALEKDFQEVRFTFNRCGIIKYYFDGRYCKNWLESKAWRSSELNTKSCIEHSRHHMSLRRDSSRGKHLKEIADNDYYPHF